MMLVFKLGIIGVYFFCFRFINDVVCMIKKGFEVDLICGEFFKCDFVV